MSVIRQLFLFVIVLGTDQVTKMIATTHSLWWQGAFFRLTKNEGIAFSVPLRGAFLWALLLCAIFFLAVFYMQSYRRGHMLHMMSIVGIIAGGASNSIDRFRFGAVIDIFALPGGLLFNIADISIFIGILFLIWPNKFSPHRL